MRSAKRWSVFLGCALAMVAAPAQAREAGAQPGFSGGPAGGAESCIACHTYNPGPGFVSLLNAPRRYRTNALYPLQVRISDTQQVGAGFQISAENLAGHLGSFELSQPTLTQLLGSYVTHTGTGYDDSLAAWAANGSSYTYSLGWRAPSTDAGRATFFVAGNAVNNFQAFEGDHYYFTHAVSTHAVPGDSDADTDIDLVDVAAFQNCFTAGAPGTVEPCLFSDFDGDDNLSLFDAFFLPGDLTGPTGGDPGGLVIADEVRGGLLYDHWMQEKGVAAPPGSHPLYPTGGPRSGATTYRCKECHGWDYNGADGAYGNDLGHFTGIPGVFGTTKSPQDIFDLLRAGTAEMPGLGHDMDAFGMTAEDIWDVTRMTLQATVDTDDYIASSSAFIGVSFFGQVSYENYCFLCHGQFGDAINFGTALDPVYVGTVANQNPWELLHKIRFGHPASPMIRMIMQGVSAQNLAHLGAYCQSLPQ